ncbi:MAG: hypothetical protein ACKO0Z_14210, partial [Betaproteobacteria bacterium]
MIARDMTVQSTFHQGRSVSSRRLTKIIGAITLSWWILVPTGLLLPITVGFKYEAYFFSLIFGEVLAITTALLLLKRAPFIGRPTRFQMLMAAMFVLFLYVSSLHPINSRTNIYVSYAFYAVAVLGGMATFLTVRTLGERSAFHI